MIYGYQLTLNVLLHPVKPGLGVAAGWRPIVIYMSEALIAIPYIENSGCKIVSSSAKSISFEGTFIFAIGFIVYNDGSTKFSGCGVLPASKTSTTFLIFPNYSTNSIYTGSISRNGNTVSVSGGGMWYEYQVSIIVGSV